MAISGISNPTFASARSKLLRGWAALDSRPVVSGFAMLFFILFLVAVYRWSRFTHFAAPPGSDGGQWLAFGRELLHGEQIKAGLSEYPPTIPFIVGAIEPLTGAMLALKLTAFGSSLAVALPVFLFVRNKMPWWLAIAVAVLPTVSPYHAEVLNFGGYPQLGGTALLILTMYLLGKAIESDDRLFYFGAAVGTTLIVATHVLALATLFLVVGPFTLLRLKANREWGDVLKPTRIRTMLWWVIPAILITLPLASVYSTYLFDADRDPNNPLRLTFTEMFHWFDSSWRWESLMWLVIGAVAIGFFLREFRRRDATYDAAVALTVVAAVGIMGLRELRYLEILELTLILWIAVGISAVLRLAPAQSRMSAGRRLALGGALALLLVIAMVGHRRTIIAGGWYRVLDHQVVSGLDYIRTLDEKDGIAVASEAVRGHNFGWWIEGYAHVPTYTVTAQYLLFQAERQQGAVAQTIISPDTPPEDVRSVAKAENIRYVFLDRETVTIPAASLVEAGFEVTFENDRIVVMEPTW